MKLKINRTVFWFILSYSLLLNLAITGVATNMSIKHKAVAKAQEPTATKTYPNIIEDLEKAPAISVMAIDEVGVSNDMSIESLQKAVAEEVNEQAAKLATK